MDVLFCIAENLLWYMVPLRAIGPGCWLSVGFVLSASVSKLANGITMGTEASYMKPNLWSLFSLWVTVGTLK